MRHHPEHVPLPVADSRDVGKRPIRVRCIRNLAVDCAVSEDYLPVVFQLPKCRLIRKIVSFHVTNGNLKHVARLRCACKWSFYTFNTHMDMPANILETS